MMGFRGNIDHWLNQAEPDYYLFFLKAWIPFNAWYIAELPHLNKKDSDIIKELQDNPRSKPRLIIESYLNNNSFAAAKFKSHLGELHNLLEAKSLIHNGAKLSFKKILLSENPDKFKKHLDEKENVYKAEKMPSFWQAYVEQKGGRVLLDYKAPIYDVENLKHDVDFIRINDPVIQKHIVECFEHINPNKPANLVSTPSDENAIRLESETPAYFINDPTSIAKGCIRILYFLRCMLFHGEIEPINSNKPVYEHSYYILRSIIKELH